MDSAMQSREKFHWFAKGLLGAGALALLLTVFQPHQHRHVSGPNLHHFCVACKANDNFGDVSIVSVEIAAFVPVTTACLQTPVEPVHFEVLLTSGPPRAPPHSA
jgi:hypothetical protein